MLLLRGQSPHESNNSTLSQTIGQKVLNVCIGIQLCLLRETVHELTKLVLILFDDAKVKLDHSL